MAKLSEAEKATLKKLREKEEAPDAPPVSKSISATVDLSDEKSVAAAIKHGFLTADEVEELQDNDDDDSDNGKKTATPRRKGYFKEKGDE